MPKDHFVYPNDSSFRIRARGRLPHWELDNGLYFFTWRLGDSLPAEALQQLRDLRDHFRGRFWEVEYFDRLIRSERELKRTIRYVLNNPIKAGLKDWPWVWLREGY